MRLPLHIAWRYLKSKKSHNVINIISGISVAGITVGTLALVVVLSVFNGLESLVSSLYNTFDPHLKVMPATGKTLAEQDFKGTSLRALNGVGAVTFVLEDKALLRYGENQYLASVKGVDSTFDAVGALENHLIDGRMLLRNPLNSFAVIGQGVAYYLNLNLNDPVKNIEAYVPRQSATAATTPDQSFKRLDIRPVGVFSVQQEFDNKYVIVPLEFAQELYEMPGRVSHAEIRLKPGTDMMAMQKRVSEVLGSQFVVKNRFEQQETLYKIMRSEKWGIFLILSFILIIAAFNIIGSLSMLILDKKKDIAVLHSLGADHRLIRKIFLVEGLFVSLSGAVMGIILGVLIAGAQQKFGFIKLQAEGGSFLIDAYPVLLKWQDLAIIFLTVTVVGILAAWIPVKSIGKIDTRSVANRAN